MRKDTRLVLALDETDGKKAMDVVRRVSDSIDAVKINWPLVMSQGPRVIDDLSEVTDVICDFKVADIPNTVNLIVGNAVARGASAVIVHAFVGEDSLTEAVKTAGKDAEIYAVTEMSHPGGLMFTAPNAEAMAILGVRCGVAGFIAPATRPERIRAIRQLIGDRKILSPGVGAQGGSAASAISAGADYVIAGRAIYGSDDPRSVAISLCDEIKTVL